MGHATPAKNVPAAATEAHEQDIHDTNDGLSLAWQERVHLADGSTIVLRRIHPSDKELFVAGFEGLSKESRYRRFFSAKPSLSPDELAYLINDQDPNNVALGAGNQDGTIGFGVARYVRVVGDESAAEVAITVVDSAQGRGIGTLLLDRLIAIARRRRIETLRFSVLVGNKPMLRLIRRMAPAAVQRRDADVVTFECALRDREPRPSGLRAGVDRIARRQLVALVELAGAARGRPRGAGSVPTHRRA